MHIPNGYLDDPVCALTTAASAAAVSYAVWKVRRRFDRSGCEALAAAGAAIFAVQMLNFPVAGGTSGHLLGAALVTLLWGPAAALVAMTCVLATQALLFGDGGISALGANVLTMGVAATGAAWAVGRLAIGEDAARRRLLVAGLAGVVSVLAAASLCAVLLALGGAAPLSAALPAMLKAHLLVGLGEGLFTAAGVAWAIRRQAAQAAVPTLGTVSRGSAARVVLCLAAGVALLLSPWASSAPDGLEAVATHLGFADRAASGSAGLAPDYLLPGIESLRLATGLAGLAGVAIVCAVGYAVAHSLTATAPKQR